MLKELLQTICEQVAHYVENEGSFGETIQSSLGPPTQVFGDPLLRFELLTVGHIANRKNTLPVPAPAVRQSYASFSFFVIAEHADYQKAIHLIELVCDSIDNKPFVQIKIKEREYEVAISAIDLSIKELNLFWLARQETHRPILFYQARVSES